MSPRVDVTLRGTPPVATPITVLPTTVSRSVVIPAPTMSVGVRVTPSAVAAVAAQPFTTAVTPSRDDLVIEVDEPTAANTGLLSTWNLTNYPVYTGASTITTAGTTISNKTIDVYLDVRAINVTISNCYFRGPATAPTGGKALVTFDNMARNQGGQSTVIDCEFAPRQPAYWINAINGHHFIAKRNKMHDCVDYFSVRIPQSGESGGTLLVTIEQNYTYDHSYYSPDPNHTDDNQTHNDTIQLQGGVGTGSSIRGNAFWGREYSATAGSGNAPDRGTGTVANGRFSGGALKAIQWTNLSGYTTDMNVFGNWMYGFNRALSAAPSSGSWALGTFYRNKIDDAQNERVGNSLSVKQGYGFRFRAATTSFTSGAGTSNKNVYMSGLSGITAGDEATIYTNA